MTKLPTFPYEALLHIHPLCVGADFSLILSCVGVTYKRMILFIAPYTFSQLGTVSNSALLLIYTFYSSPFYMH
jgi:hypothetical protein